MSLWFSRYTLTPRRRLSAIARPGAREGALIRAADGFADLHPWPELGDAPLDEQLARLARGETLPALHHARVDAEARARGVSLFDGLTIPESHWPGDDPPDAFDTVKLKGVQSIPPRVRLRIDFNATLTPEEFVRIAETLPHERIDFIEDPVPYDEEVWEQLRERTQLRLALDRGHGVADVLIHKPALSETFPAFNGEIVVTSYMDHPIGQLFAAYVAATHDVSARCGLFTHVLYEPDEFIERIRADGARLLPPEGTGIGFDDLLERLPWQRL
jgi:O-succinylbenzoate synthase